LNCSKFFGLPLIVATAFSSATVSATDLGTIGPTYPIAEKDAVEQIMEKLKAKQKSGELASIINTAKERSIQSIKNPRGNNSITTVSERTYRLIDPSIHYDKAVTTDEGQIIVPAGAKINPLTITALTKRLVFFDGRDQAQREAVRKMSQKYGSKITPILTAGSWFDITKEWKRQVYFDQQGTLSRRFGIDAVPSVISQRNNQLLIEEIPAKDLQ
jgi:conjugal transfer pilus assembly protein TraW